MSLFLVLSALLVAGVLALLLWPLLSRGNAHPSGDGTMASNARIYREQLAEIDSELEAGIITREQWTAARSEVERRVLDDGADVNRADRVRSPRAAIVVAIAVPLLAVALYAWLGNPEAFSPTSGANSASAHDVTPDQIAGMVDRLELRLRDKPDDTDGWILLGRSRAAMGRYDEAAKAYGKAASQRPKDADLLADFADVLAMAHGRKLEGEPAALIARALALDPENVKALSISGTIAFDRKDFAGAVKYWKRALALAPAESEFAASVRSSIAEAEGSLGVKPTAGLASADESDKANKAGDGQPAAVALTGASLSGRVTLGKAALARAQPEDSVFVFARAAEGPRMPLAVMRRQVKDLPFDFSLDDSMAMMPTLKISGFPKVVVVARISKSGLANPGKGDLEAASSPMAPGARGIKLEIANPVN